MRRLGRFDAACGQMIDPIGLLDGEDAILNEFPRRGR